MGSTDPVASTLNSVSADDVIKLAGPQVNFADVVKPLLEFAVHMGYVHRILFGVPLVVTSGKDSVHSQGSLHNTGRAVDVRVRDLDEADQNVFIAVLTWAAPARQVAVFDERALGAESHVHLEYHGA